jgi:hypothetical protein
MMNFEKVAWYLFIVRVHAELLIERGDLPCASNSSGQQLVDDASIERHQARLKLAARAHFVSRDESNDPLGI